MLRIYILTKTKSKKNAERQVPFSLSRDVVDPGYCIGCSLCAVVAPEEIEIQFNREGFYQASEIGSLSQDSADRISRICPFSNAAPSENELGQSLFKDVENESEYIGRYLSSHAIRVEEGDFRKNGSSAGFGSWILCEMLRRGVVDAIIHVGVPKSGIDSEQKFFGYCISETPEEVQRNSRTKYYPIELASVLSQLADDDRKYAITGLPCFIKGIQALRREDERWRRQICFTVALFCGHLKSKLLAENIIEGSGTVADQITSFRFRDKSPGDPANKYVAQVVDAGGNQRRVAWSTVFGTDWATGFFKYMACNFCDDVVGETADISVGDAWLAEYVEDSMGTNNVIIRNSILREFVMCGIAEGRLWSEPLSESDVLRSTAGGFRDRREGLSSRLYMERAAGRNPPTKRVAPTTDGIERSRRELYALKMMVAWLSPKAYLLARKLRCRAVFVFLMAPYIAVYKYQVLHFILRIPLFTTLNKLVRRFLPTYLVGASERKLRIPD